MSITSFSPIVKMNEVMTIKWRILWMILYFPLTLWSQIDTTISITEVNIVAPSIRNKTIGDESQIWSNKTQQQLSSLNIADFLNTETGVFIKSYGSGNLATSSMRGGSAGHTLVLWNDVPIQSPMLGLLDLSLLPMGFADEISVQYGGNSAMWGSGAIGGVIAMNNRADFLKGQRWNHQTVFGSFGNIRQHLKLEFGNKKLQSRTSISHQQADNNFFYPISPTLPKRQQTNSTFQQQNVLQDIFYKINSTQTLSAHIWWQQSDRKIPPLITQNQSRAHQNDNALRMVLDWKKVNTKSVLKSKIGFLKEHLDYYDDIIKLISLSEFSTVLAELNSEISINNHQKWYLGTTQTFTKALADGYQDKPSEYRGALFTSYQLNYDRWKVQISARQEMVNGRLVPIVPTLGVDKPIGERIILKFKISRNYRLPTLNDKFWQPGGNPNLLAESGWSQSLTVAMKHQKNDFHIGLTTTAFNRNINNWILWSLVSGQQFWSANNIAKVWSRGLENHLRLSLNKSHGKYELIGGYNLVRSTNEIAVKLPKIPKGQQLYYTPEHQLFGKVAFHKKNLSIAYQHSYTSATLGINENVASYHLGDFRVNYQLNHAPLGSRLFFNIHNIWNTSYYVVERRPMSGRAFQVGINLSFNQFK